MRALGILHITSTVLILSILEQLATNAFKLQLAINNRRPLAAKCTSVDQDFSSEELKNLQNLAQENKDEWGKMLKQKLSGWSSLKQAGELDLLATADSDDLDEVIGKLDMKLSMPSMPKGGPKTRGSDATSANDKKFMEKLKKCKTALSLNALFNELKDKETLNRNLVEEVLLALSRTDVSSPGGIITTTFMQFLAFEGKFEKKPAFYMKFLESLYYNGHVDDALEVKRILIEMKGLDFNSKLAKAMTISGELCTSVYGDRKDFPRNFEVFKNEIKLMSISQVNNVIRVLGKYRLLRELFEVLDLAKKTASIRVNGETLEFISNALVLSVDEVSRARSMADLPKPNVTYPEVVFIGRSNVGKSSLASTSATPGHTKEFHFYAVNKDRKDIQSFYLVDVPGVGFAQVDEAKMDSWRNLIERYLQVRSTLQVVFHLIDARLPEISETDLSTIALVSKTLSSRLKAGLPSFQYTILLTKVDKASERDIASVRKAIGLRLGEFSNDLNVQTLQTSSVTKEGRDSVWSILGKKIYAVV